jgi:hypothetical protein
LDSLEAFFQIAQTRIEELALPRPESRESVQLIQARLEQLALEERLKVIRQERLARRSVLADA